MVIIWATGYANIAFKLNVWAAFLIVFRQINIFSPKIYNTWDTLLHTYSSIKTQLREVKVKKSLPYSLMSVGPGADPSVKVISPQVTFQVIPGGRLSLLFVRAVFTFQAEECHHPSTITKLYCLVTEAHRCEQLAQGVQAISPQVTF